LGAGLRFGPSWSRTAPWAGLVRACGELACTWVSGHLDSTFCLQLFKGHFSSVRFPFRFTSSFLLVLLLLCLHSCVRIVSTHSSAVNPV